MQNTFSYIMVKQEDTRSSKACFAISPSHLRFWISQVSFRLSVSLIQASDCGEEKKKQGPISASPNCKQSKPIKRNKNKPEDCRGIYFSTKPVVGVANYPERRRVAGRRAGRPFPTASTSSVYAAAMSTVVLGKGLCGEGCSKMLITKRDFVRRSRFMSGCDSFQLLLIVVGIEVI